MSHEHALATPSPEHHEEREKAELVFKVDRMEPRQVAGLIKALDIAVHSQNKDVDSPDYDIYDELSRQLHRDLESLARTSDNALEVYGELIAGELANEGTQGSAAMMIPDLLRRNLDDPEKKQRVAELAVRIMQGDGLGQEVAGDVVTQIVWKDWLDEPTARYLDSFLPNEEDRRWS